MVAIYFLIFEVLIRSGSCNDTSGFLVIERMASYALYTLTPVDKKEKIC